MLHSNSTTYKTKMAKFEASKPGFTHIYTPNDFELKFDEILDALGKMTGVGLKAMLLSML
jgi:hypothetical protein